jgi:hypothetical protein
MKYFCSKCGKTSLYSIDLPKFCSFCGKSFASTIQKRPDPDLYKNELKLKQNINTDEDILSDDDNYVNIDFKKIKASFTLDVYKPKGETFGNLLDNPVQLTTNNFKTSSQPRSKDDILLEFKKEAGASRSNS